MSKDPKDQFKSWLNETWDGVGEPTNIAEVVDTRSAIVEQNVKMLVDRQAWHENVVLFEKTVPEKEREDYTIHFDLAAISQGDFVRYRFPCSVCFEGTTFSAGHLRFDQTVFDSGDISFARANFCKGAVTFISVQFGNGRVSFLSARFEGPSLSFSGATFGNGEVFFRGVEMRQGEVYFEGTKFGQGDVNFSWAEFGTAIVSFDSCQLAGRFLFGAPNGTRKSKLSGRLSMRGVQFPALVDFFGREFEQVPDFVGSTFAVPPDLSRVKVGSPKMVGKWRPASFKIAEDQDDAARYRKLKAMAIATNDHEKELEFFAHELRCKRGHETTGMASFLNSMFELFSNYGQSILRPFFSLVIFAVLFFGAYWLVEGVSWVDAAMHSFYTSFPFLKMLGSSAIAACTDCAFDPLDILTPIHTLFSLAFLFLILLGLRNRFKIK